MSFCGCILMIDVYILPTIEMYWGKGNSEMALTTMVQSLKHERFTEIRSAFKNRQLRYNVSTAL